MSDNNGTQNVAPGWYADPAGSPQLRWWDGTQWTDHLQAPAAPAYGAAPTLPSVPAGAPVYGPFIWIITLLPLLSLFLLPLALTGIEEQIRSAISDPYGTSPYGSMSMAALGAQALSNLISLALYAAIVVLAYFDRKWLLRNGIAQPFHWAWAFLSVVYPIGRSVVVRRRSGRGIAPMWVSIALVAVSLIAVIGIFFYVFGLAYSLAGAGSYT